VVERGNCLLFRESKVTPKYEKGVKLLLLKLAARTFTCKLQRVTKFYIRNSYPKWSHTADEQNVFIEQ
jgi:hypothetical protein